ncbi:MAG: TetR/AcrR family transcriptional regulator C-terminal domain-containing protein [Actinomycetota bacterium]|nr:TetR/AcrR family transcriptional regulator C-terminal domain-containing protein [Actinomycetota bacterium]
MTDTGRETNAPMSRQLVLTTALAIIDRDGVDGLSLRRLAQALGRDPMTLYRYAKGKPALLDGVVELVMSQLTIDATDDDWAGQLRKAARSFRQMALDHPKVVPLIVTRPLVTPLALRAPSTLRPFEDCLELLTRAGFTDSAALAAYRIYSAFLNGHILNELQAIVDNADETDALLRLGLHNLPAREFPLLRGLAPVLATYDGEAELERGLDILLPALAPQPR